MEITDIKKVAHIWFSKGLKEFSEHLQKGFIPNWNKFFNKLWIEFTELKLKCTICGNIKTFKLDFDFEVDELDIKKYLDTYLTLICIPCHALVDMDKWVIVGDKK